MEFMNVTVCRLCLSDGSANNMVPLIDKSENRLTCHGLSIVKITQIKISVFDNLPKFMCKTCLMHLKQSIEFKLRCEKSSDCLNNIVKTLQNEYTDTETLQAEIIQHAMFINSNIISPDESDSMPFVPITQKVQSHKANPENILSSLNWQEKVSETPITSNHDELLNTIESLYCSDYKETGINTDTSCIDSDQNLQDNMLLPSLEAIVNEQLSRHKNTKTSTRKKEKQPKLSQSLNDAGALVLIDKMFKKYPQCFSSEKSISKEYVCKICNKVLANIHSYKYHSRQHKNMYKLICEHCGKGFQFQNHLNLHTVAVHKTGEYVQCKICPFKAARPFLLVEHERLHTGERPFACDKCGLTFRRQAILKNHSKYHKEKTVQCPHCPKKFFSKWHMLSHINSSHERSYLYLCPVCGVKYAKNTTVRRHLFEKHGVAKHLQGKITRIKV